MAPSGSIWHKESLKLKEIFGTREGFEICPNNFSPRPNFSPPGMQPHAAACMRNPLTLRAQPLAATLVRRRPLPPPQVDGCCWVMHRRDSAQCSWRTDRYNALPPPPRLSADVPAPAWPAGPAGPPPTWHCPPAAPPSSLVPRHRGRQAAEGNGGAAGGGGGGRGLWHAAALAAGLRHAEHVLRLNALPFSDTGCGTNTRTRQRTHQTLRTTWRMVHTAH